MKRYFRLKLADAYVALHDVWRGQDEQGQERTVFSIFTLGKDALVSVYAKADREAEDAFIGALTASGCVFNDKEANRDPATLRP